MLGPLTTSVFAGQPGHAILHNEERQAIDDLQTAVAQKAPISAAWAPNMPVQAGQLVTYSGVVYTVNADGVTGATFSTANLTVSTDASALHVAGTETITGAKTFTTSPVVPTPTATGAATPKSYVDGLVSPNTAALTTYGHESITIPAAMFSQFSTSNVSTQTVAGIKSTIVLDDGTAPGIIHAVGIALPTDWATFNIEADFQLFAAATSSTTNVAQVAIAIVQYGDPGAIPTAPTLTYQGLTLPVGSQVSVAATSATVTRTAGKAIIYVARDGSNAGDTFGSRLIPTSVRLNWVS